MNTQSIQEQIKALEETNLKAAYLGMNELVRKTRKQIAELKAKQTN